MSRSKDTSGSGFFQQRALRGGGVRAHRCAPVRARGREGSEKPSSSCGSPTNTICGQDFQLFAVKRGGGETMEVSS
jgi:hypothetical protein